MLRLPLPPSPLSLSFLCPQEMLTCSPSTTQGYPFTASCPSGAQQSRREEAVRSRRRWHSSKRIEYSSREAPRSYVLRPGKADVNNIQTTKSSHIIEVEKLAGNVPWSCGVG
jgi:hypothetical protein